MVYKCLTESLLTFNITSWYGNLSVKQKNKPTQVVNQASKIIGDKQLQHQDLCSQSTTKKAIQIYNDPPPFRMTVNAISQQTESPSGQEERLREMIYSISCDHPQKQLVLIGALELLLNVTEQ